ncbi:MAG TPA: hypothetical protein VMT80_00830 [Candidatus Paceibacterota bacterium]|nr:hypothetical protein [Candidatus Paceibacterota bacterium]
MDMKPIYRAILAAGYIALIALLMTWVTSSTHGPDTVLAPLVVLSVLVLSVVIMAFLFFADPVRRLIAGDARGAVRSFLATAGWFALFPLLFLAATLIIQHN